VSRWATLGLCVAGVGLAAVVPDINQIWSLIVASLAHAEGRIQPGEIRRRGREKLGDILALICAIPFQICDCIDNLNGEGQMFLTAKLLLTLARLLREEQMRRFDTKLPGRCYGEATPQETQASTSLSFHPG